MRYLISIALTFSLVASAQDAGVAQSWYVQKDQHIVVPDDGVLLNDAAAKNVEKAIKDLRDEHESQVKKYNDLADVANSSLTPKMVLLIGLGALVTGAAIGAGIAVAASGK